MNHLLFLPLSALSYRIAMEPFRTPLSDSYLTVENVKILGCFREDGLALGFAMYILGETRGTILCVEAGEDDCDTLSALLGEIRRMGEKAQLQSISWQTSDPHVPEGFRERRRDWLYRVGKEEKPTW